MYNTSTADTAMPDPITAITTNDIALNTPFVGLKIPTPLRNQRGIVDHPCEKAHRARHPSFLEPCQYELLRTPCIRTWEYWTSARSGE
jgi:hypothetical protein